MTWLTASLQATLEATNVGTATGKALSGYAFRSFCTKNNADGVRSSRKHHVIPPWPGEAGWLSVKYSFDRFWRTYYCWFRRLNMFWTVPACYTERLVLSHGEDDRSLLEMCSRKRVAWGSWFFFFWLLPGGVVVMHLNGRIRWELIRRYLFDGVVFQNPRPRYLRIVRHSLQCLGVGRCYPFKCWVCWITSL